MTPEAQRIAIAEAVPGWRTSHGAKYCTWVAEAPKDASVFGIFDPLSDLNAMYQAIVALPDYQYRAYYVNLIAICTSQLDALRATPAEQAEAYLRAILKWTD